MTIIAPSTKRFGCYVILFISIMKHKKVFFYKPRTDLSAIKESGTGEAKLTWNEIKKHMKDTINKLVAQKFEKPSQGKEELVKKYKALYDEITDGFRNMDE